MIDPSDSRPASYPVHDSPVTTGDLISMLSRKVVGQTSATSAFVSYVYMYQSGLASAPATQTAVMTRGGLSDEELAVCRERGIPTLFKPFLASEVLRLIRGPYHRRSAVAAGSALFAEPAGRADSA